MNEKKNKKNKNMSNYFQLYLLTRLDGIIISLGILLTLSAIAYCSYALNYYFDEDELPKSLIRFVVTWSITLLITILIPSKEDMVLIIAGGKTMDFIESDSSINKIPGQATKAITDMLQKHINELEKNEGNGK